MTQLVSGHTKTKPAFRKSGDSVRLFDPWKKEYLHLSGTGTTKNTTYAWIGTKRQAKTLRDQAVESGQQWPYKAVSSEGVTQ